MNLTDLRKHCVEQQKMQGTAQAYVVLVLPGRWGKRDTRRLWPGGPAGRIVAEKPKGLVVMFRADEVLAALNAEGECPLEQSD